MKLRKDIFWRNTSCIERVIRLMQAFETFQNPLECQRRIFVEVYKILPIPANITKSRTQFNQIQTHPYSIVNKTDFLILKSTLDWKNLKPNDLKLSTTKSYKRILNKGINKKNNLTFFWVGVGEISCIWRLQISLRGEFFRNQDGGLHQKIFFDRVIHKLWRSYNIFSKKGESRIVQDCHGFSDQFPISHFLVIQHQSR